MRHELAIELDGRSTDWSIDRWSTMATCFFIECNDVLAKKEKKTNDELKLNYSRYPILDQANNKGHHALA